MSVAVYLRVSTKEQNLDGQRAQVERWLKGQGIDPGGVLWFVDKETGDTLARPAFRDLQDAVFVVYRLDRLSRSMLDGLNVLADWLGKGVRLVSVCERFDFAGVVGQMVAALLLGIAQMEQQTRRERQAAGIEQAKAKGKYTGRKPGTLKASPARAKALQAKGLSVPEIAASLGVSARSVRRYLGQGQPASTQ